MGHLACCFGKHRNSEVFEIVFIGDVWVQEKKNNSGFMLNGTVKKCIICGHYTITETTNKDRANFNIDAVNYDKIKGTGNGAMYN